MIELSDDFIDYLLATEKRKKVIRPFAKQNALLHRQRVEELERRRLEELRPTHLNGSTEAEVFLVSELKPWLDEWRRLWDIKHDRRTAQLKSDMPVMGPMQFLAGETGIHVRKIAAIMADPNKDENTPTYISFSRAEKLLQAIDREYLIDNGTLQSIKNPQWSFRKWIDFWVKSGCYDDMPFP